MSGKKRSLADELAELFNPAPTKEFDPEADPFGGGPALVESDEELAADIAGSRRRGKERAMRLRGDIQLEGAHYKGRRTSRAAAFGGGSDSEPGSGSEGEEEEGEGFEEGAPGSPLANGAAHGSSSEEEDAGGLASEGEEEGSEEEGSEGLAPAGDEFELLDADALEDLGGSGSESEEGGGSESGDEAGSSPAGSDFEGGSDEDEDAEEAGGQGAAGARGQGGGEMDALEREYEALRAAEAEAAAGLRERAQRERQKALAVKSQQALWQRGLEMRILLQRTLAGANKLPQAAAQVEAAGYSEELAGAFSGLAQEAAGLLGELSELVEALHAQNAAVGEAAKAAGAAKVGEKRRREEGEAGAAPEALWAELDGLYSGFAPFRDASIDRWHRKTTLTTGGIVRSSLRALNQSVSTQVAALMRDPHKLVQRARLPRLHSRPLCTAEAADAQAPAGEGGSGGEDGAAAAAAAGSSDRDPETFDDAEFYQTLLKEFLEGSGAAGGGGNYLSGPKQRKAVDRRASKGRKIRYHVHDKLVNFMAPVELEEPQFAAQLFRNLFGGTRSNGAAGAAR